MNNSIEYQGNIFCEGDYVRLVINCSSVRTGETLRLFWDNSTKNLYAVPVDTVLRGFGVGCSCVDNWIPCAPPNVTATGNRVLGGCQPNEEEEKDVEEPKEKLTNKIMQNLRSIWNGITMSEPEKTFRKAGIIQESGELTIDGRDLFISFLLKKFGDEFKKDVVDVVLREQEMGNANKL